MTKKPSAAIHIKTETHDSPLWTWTRSLFTAFVATLFVLPLNAQAADTICAKVKIEIVQELTMERQDFDAMMKITNGLTTSSLDHLTAATYTNQTGTPQSNEAYIYDSIANCLTDSKTAG